MDPSAAEEATILLAIQQTLRGATSAFGVVVEQYSGPLYSLARNYGRSHEEAEEDVQEIFLSVYRGLPRFDLSRRFKPWLFQIAVNQLRSVRRRRARRSSRADVINADDQMLAEIACDSSQAPEHLALERVADDDVTKALETLPQRWRDVFVLRQLQSLSSREAALILNLPEETVRTHLFRARRALQDYLRNRGWN